VMVFSIVAYVLNVTDLYYIGQMPPPNFMSEPAHQTYDSLDFLREHSKLRRENNLYKEGSPAYVAQSSRSSDARPVITAEHHQYDPHSLQHMSQSPDPHAM
jgi:hypothetical protein